MQKNRSQRSFEWYEGHIRGFLTYLGDNKKIPATLLKPYHVVEWVDSHGESWGDTYKGGAIVAIKRIFNWAEELGYIEISPIKKLKKPQAKRRDNHMTPEDYKKIIENLDSKDPFRDFISFMWHTGCRPQEARHVEPRHVYLDRECIIIPKEEAKGKRKARFIYMQGEALEIVKRLMNPLPSGKIFKNSRGNGWSKYSICNRMDRLSKKTGRKLAAYDTRHGFATRKLLQGLDHIVVAALMGHTNGSMLATVYSHVDKDEDHLKRALAE